MFYLYNVYMNPNKKRVVLYRYSVAGMDISNSQETRNAGRPTATAVRKIPATAWVSAKVGVPSATAVPATAGGVPT